MKRKQKKPTGRKQITEKQALQKEYQVKTYTKHSGTITVPTYLQGAIVKLTKIGTHNNRAKQRNTEEK